jgi:cytochrome o ubiquinol oxidase operon protein cyoD
MSQTKAVISHHESEPGSLKSYVFGFVASIALTLIAYLLVIHHALSNKWALTILIGGLALVQCVIQLRLFLHLGQESKPKYKTLVFSFMMFVILILISGSIWIMYHLDGRMMTPQKINQYMMQQDDGGL